MSKKKELTPIDFDRCQVMKPNGNSFMTLGGQPGLERCTKKPTFIISEDNPGKDGRRGSMSMCGICYSVFKKQWPGEKHTAWNKVGRK